MENDVLVKVEGVSKKFCRNLKRSLVYGGADIINGFVGRERTTKLRKDEFWAIDNVSFELKRGECLGLIGHNGAGKSTLLKMLNGLISIDCGRIEMRGKVSALIELGAGFSPLLTGRENIYNNGAVLGFTKEEIDRKFDAILEFAELNDFIDTPLQNYSSGMKVRLGFAVAAQLEPDILLIDEVLAVGDMGFVLKCFNRMDKLLQNTAMIFVSHSMPQVARMCTKILVMDKGRPVEYSTNITEGLAKYYSKFKMQIGDYKGSDRADLVEVKLVSNGNVYSVEDEIEIEYGASMELHMKVRFNETIVSPDIYVVFYDKEQRGFAEIFNFSDQLEIQQASGVMDFQATIHELFFTQGKYSITIAMIERDGGKNILFRHQSAIYFDVKGGFHGWVPVQINPSWKINK